MENISEFKRFLRRGGRKPSVADRVIRIVSGYEAYLLAQRGAKGLNQALEGDLEAYVAWVESGPDAKSAKTHLWAICYYYEFIENKGLHRLASLLRQQRITRKPFSLKDFRGVDPQDAAKLAEVGIRNVKQMLAGGKTPQGRQALADKTGIPIDKILELVKLSDLARIPGVKGIRARLYHDAGTDSIENLAQWNAEELKVYLEDFVRRTDFDGIAPLPAEIRFTLDRARELPKVVEY
jgi:hypothetical protein